MGLNTRPRWPRLFGEDKRESYFSPHSSRSAAHYLLLEGPLLHLYAQKSLDKDSEQKLTSVMANRSAAIGSTEIMSGDKLILRGLKFHGFHGVKPEERTLGQKFLIDVDAWMDLQAAGKSDHLSDTISYTEIYRIVKEVLEGQPHNLLESVAHQIASTTLTNYPQIAAVRVKVGKPHVAVQGPLDYLGVEILRQRGGEMPK